MGSSLSRLLGYVPVNVDQFHVARRDFIVRKMGLKGLVLINYYDDIESKDKVWRSRET